MHSVKEWKHPEDYLGETWKGWYSAGFGQSRDSDCLEQSNFQTVYDELRPLDSEFEGETTVRIIRAGHWAVGWVEWIAIHSSNTAALQRARQLCDRANDYPVLNEEDFSQREWDSCEQVWRDCFDPAERVRYFRKHSYTSTGLSDLLQAIRNGSWQHAADMLDCPSDLLY